MSVLICCWSLVSFYKSVFDFLEDDILDFLGFDDDVLEDTDLSLVSFYKSVFVLICCCLYFDFCDGFWFCSGFLIFLKMMFLIF
ncbi:hypothetical protein Hanom_Chr05g00388101 [Helianthus anomalus]